MADLPPGLSPLDFDGEWQPQEIPDDQPEYFWPDEDPSWPPFEICSTHNEPASICACNHSD